MDKTRSELSLLKEKLDLLSTTYLDKLQDVDKKEEKWKLIEERANEILQQNPEEIIRLNVGGTIFVTKISTLLSAKNSLFTKLLAENRTGKEDLFIDRSPQLFAEILQYLRTGKLNKKRLYKQLTYEEVMQEAEFYEIADLIDTKTQINKPAKFISLSVSAYYNNSQGHITILEDRNIAQGILTNSPGWLIVELENEVNIETLEIGGYTGDQAWNYPTGYGAGGRVYTSLDKKDWKTVGTIPSGFGDKIVEFKVTPSIGRYIKLDSQNWLAVGFLRVVN